MSAPPREGPSPWWVVVTTSLSSMAVLGNSIGMISLLLPRMMSEYGVDVRGIQWVLTAFMLTQVVVMPAVGWLGAAVGQKRLYLWSLAVFTVCTLLCTLARDFSLLVALRVLQGASAGFFFPMGTPFIFDVFPEGRRGFVLGFANLVQTAGSLAGSVIAAHLADLFGWRWGFYYFIVLCLGGLLVGSIHLRERPLPAAGRFDLAGSLTLGTALVTLVLLLTLREDTSLPAVLGLCLLCLASAGAFLWTETHVASPLVDLGIYRHAAFTAGNILGFLLPAVTVASSLLLPIYLQDLLGYSIFQSSLIRLPSGIVSACVPPISGWLSDRVDPRLLISGGLLGFAISLFGFSTLSLASSWASIVFLLTIMTGASMFVWTPMSNTMFSSVPLEKVRLGSGLHALMRQLGRSVGGAVISILFTRHLSARLTVIVGGVATGSAVLSDHLDRMAGVLRLSGHPDPHAGATRFLHQTMWNEAAVGAFSDCYVQAAFFMLLFLIPAWFLRGRES